MGREEGGGREGRILKQLHQLQYIPMSRYTCSYSALLYIVPLATDVDVWRGVLLVRNGSDCESRVVQRHHHDQYDGVHHYKDQNQQHQVVVFDELRTEGEKRRCQNDEREGQVS